MNQAKTVSNRTGGSLLAQLDALMSDTPYAVTNLSNAAALLFLEMERINWVGFYLYREGELILGPFQGKPACTRIPMGKGVCGTAAETKRTRRVPDVHAFPGHIACDGASRSELVVPLICEGKLYGVLDIDSPFENRFSEADQAQIEEVAEHISQMLSTAS